MKIKRQLVTGVRPGRIAVRGLAEGKPKPGATQRVRPQNVEYYQTLIENTVDGIAVVLPDGAFRYYSPSFYSLLGYTAREILGFTLFDLIHPDDLPKLRAAFTEGESAPGTRMLLEIRMKHKNRQWHILECHLINLLRNQTVEGLVLYLTDITERALAEREINENRAQLRSLATALTMAEEKERRDLATQLHDSIGQTLALANMKLGALLAMSASDDQTGRINEVRDLIREMIETTRTLTFNLSPPILYSVGFEAAVEWLGKRIRDQHGIDFKLHSFGLPRAMGEDLRVLLFHVVRELLFNIVKHAEAKIIKIFASGGENGVSVVIEDDGKGFDTGILLKRRADAGGFGLFSIHERLNHMGGSFQIHSADGQGTTVSFSVPFGTPGGGKTEDGDQNHIGG